jgi:hypothetical protein
VGGQQGTSKRTLNWSFERWHGGADVRQLSLAARGLWFEMLGVMNAAPRRGYLVDRAGCPLDAAGIACAIFRPESEVAAIMPELEASGVFSRDDAGIYCRGMVRDERRRIRCSQAGKKGGNPSLKPVAYPTRLSHARASPEAQSQTCTCGDDQKLLFAEIDAGGVGGGLSNGSGSLNKKDLRAQKRTKKQPGAQVDLEIFKDRNANQAIADWLEHKRERGESYKEKGLIGLLKRLGSWGEQRAIDAITFSIANNYQGIYEPRSDNRSRRAVGGAGQAYDPEAKARDPKVGKF